jgi:membrane dipeptidase
VADAIDACVQLIGDSAHVAIGSDFDGGFGAESIPREIETVADLGKIGLELEKRGYRPEDTAAILGGNWYRKLRDLLK